MNKLLFTDIDGTLTNSKGKIPEENIKTINRLADKGIKTVLCTGRNITKSLPVAKELNRNLPMVCIDGILLYDVKNKRIPPPLWRKGRRRIGRAVSRYGADV